LSASDSLSLCSLLPQSFALVGGGGGGVIVVVVVVVVAVLAPP
jgi:hypothetical protein